MTFTIMATENLAEVTRRRTRTPHAEGLRGDWRFLQELRRELK
jgi:hypothetical protein